MFDHVLKSDTPVFDKSTEEGIRFLVYKVGCLEVRTVQEPKADEIVGVVFSVGAETQAVQSEKDNTVNQHEQITKATVYVEMDQRWLSYHHYYLVLHTDGGNTVLMEKLWDGSGVCKDNPGDLEARNSLAKAFHSSCAVVRASPSRT